MESHVYHCTGQSYVSVLSHCPMWDRWDSPMESHVYHCTGKSYVSVLSHCPMWDTWDSPMESHVYHCTGQSYVCVRLASFPGLSGEGGKAWGLLRAHARKLPQNVVIAYYSNLSATFVSILSVKAWERG